MKIVVSACIMGENCKYNGKNNKNQLVIDFLKDKEVVCICPEMLAGLGVPRPCAEISTTLTPTLTTSAATGICRARPGA